MSAPLAGRSRFARLRSRYRRRFVHRLGLGFVLALFAVALLADFIASDKPLAVRRGGQTWLFPNLTDPKELRQEDNQSLRASLHREAGDWMLEPPVPFGPYRTDLGLAQLPEGPSERHLLGTDETGRDVAARLVHGTRVSLAVGLVAVALYVLIGVLLGAVAGYFGGAVDLVVSRGVEVMLTFPTLFLVLALMAVIPRPTLTHLVLVLGLTRWPDVARLMRAEVLRVKELEFVTAARALGASELRILFRHVVPNCLAPVMVAAAFGVAGAVLLESALSFLGFGAPPPTASWGEILMQAHRYVTSPGAWWLALFPGAAIFLTVTAYNLVGEGLQEALDPRL
ncbi:MAG TPA: ABC transporter permease [Myxococcales bacterium]|jgi:peptide/nickel transport system permease protein